MILGLLLHLCSCEPVILGMFENLGDGLPFGVAGWTVVSASLDPERLSHSRCWDSCCVLLSHDPKCVQDLGVGCPLGVVGIGAEPASKICSGHKFRLEWALPLISYRELLTFPFSSSSCPSLSGCTLRSPIHWRFYESYIICLYMHTYTVYYSLVPFAEDLSILALLSIIRWLPLHVLILESSGLVHHSICPFSCFDLF